VGLPSAGRKGVRAAAADDTGGGPAVAEDTGGGPTSRGLGLLRTVTRLRAALSTSAEPAPAAWHRLREEGIIPGGGSFSIPVGGGAARLSVAGAVGGASIRGRVSGVKPPAGIAAGATPPGGIPAAARRVYLEAGAGQRGSAYFGYGGAGGKGGGDKWDQDGECCFLVRFAFASPPSPHPPTHRPRPASAPRHPFLGFIHVNMNLPMKQTLCTLLPQAAASTAVHQAASPKPKSSKSLSKASPVPPPTT
jgi:hypothetical protein